MDRSFFFFPVYLYSSAYRLIINIPTRRYAGCSRGCPAAFKHGFHLALVPESQLQKIRVNMWMSTGCVHQQSFQRNSPLWCICKSITFHSKDTNTTITCNSLKKNKKNKKQNKTIYQHLVEQTQRKSVACPSSLTHMIQQVISKLLRLQPDPPP